MENGHPFTETGAEATLGLRNQGDFGYQHQNAALLSDGVGRRP